METWKRVTDNLIKRYPVLESCHDSVDAAVREFITCYENGGKLLVCGNGGSAADASHIAGELVKGFLKKRPLDEEARNRLLRADPSLGRTAGNMLQSGLPAIPLNAFDSLTTSISNDIGSSAVFAQQIMALGNMGDLFLAISTSGNSENIILAAVAARAEGMKVLGLTGRSGGSLKKYCDVCINVPADETMYVQELHVPVYHAVCAAVEEYFFGGES